MIVNTRILKHPANWFVVGLMLTLIGIAGHLLLSYFGHVPAQPTPVAPEDQNNPASTPVGLRWDGTYQAVSVGR